MNTGQQWTTNSNSRNSSQGDIYNTARGTFRTATACYNCKVRKTKCSASQISREEYSSNPHETLSCDRCIQRNLDCRGPPLTEYQVPIRSMVTRKVYNPSSSLPSSIPPPPPPTKSLSTESPQLNAIHSRLKRLDDRIGINTLYTEGKEINSLDLSLILRRLDLIEEYLNLKIDKLLSSEKWLDSYCPDPMKNESSLKNESNTISSLDNWNGKGSSSRTE